MSLNIARDTTAAVIEDLRERIRRLQAAPRTSFTHQSTGIARLDAFLPARGLPFGHAVELTGEAASGRTSAALSTLAAAHRTGRLGAWVDGSGEFYAPAAAAFGVDLEQLLLVQPGEPQQRVWATVQLLRSGAFPCVVLDLAREERPLTQTESKRLCDAAFRGGSLLLLLSSRSAPAGCPMRLSFQARGAHGCEVELLRSRQGGTARTLRLPWSVFYSDALALPPDAWVAPVLPRERERAAPAFGHTRRSDARNDCGGITGQRPGRDMGLPSFGSTLGL